MIKEIREDFHSQQFPLEDFLLANFDRYQKEYELPEMLMYLNFDKISEEEKTPCPIIAQKLKELIKEDWDNE